MDTRTQTIPIYRKDSVHPQAMARAACEVRSTALFGVLDDEGLDRIHTQIDSMTLAPDATVYDRGTAGLAVFTIREGLVRFERGSEHGDRRIVPMASRLVSALRREGVLTLTPARSALLDRVALRAALLAEGAA